VGLIASNVLNDRTLRAIVHHLPADQLLHIAGVGPAKVGEYGEQIPDLCMQVASKPC